MLDNIKMTKMEIEDWNKCYEYVKRDILGYIDKNLPKNIVLRLKGLHEGKFMSNKSTKPRANYTYKQILTTFKLYKYEIINGLKNNERIFKDEGHRFNYIMVIIEKKINDVVDKINRVEKAKIQGAKVVIDIVEEKAKYTTKTKESNNDRLNDLW